MDGVQRRVRYWRSAVRAGTTWLNGVAAWVSLGTLILAVTAGIAVPLTTGASGWITVTVLLAIALAVIAEGGYREWDKADRAAHVAAAPSHELAALRQHVEEVERTHIRRDQLKNYIKFTEQGDGTVNFEVWDGDGEPE